MTSPRVVLVGPPGAGKSTIGSALARRLGVDFRDTDADVEATLGKPISDVFVDDGEAVFRAAERSAVAAALDEHDGVLALGGGAVVDPATRARLRGHQVVFLDVSLASAVSRVGLARDRPLLLGSPRSQLKTLMDARRPWYAEVATVTVDTSTSEPADVVEAIVASLDAS